MYVLEDVFVFLFIISSSEMLIGVIVVSSTTRDECNWCDADMQFSTRVCVLHSHWGGWMYILNRAVYCSLVFHRYNCL